MYDVHNDILDAILVGVGGLCFVLSGYNEYLVLISIVCMGIFTLKL